MTITAYPINAVDGVPAYTARQGRQALAALMLPGANPLRSRSGFRPGGTPVVTVTASTWSVGPFSGVVDPGISPTQGPYLVASDATEQGDLLPADGSQPRRDILYVQVDDADEDTSGERRARVLYLAGAPSASPVPPSVPPRSLRIGVIDVPQVGGGSPAFTMDRRYTTAAGGIVPVVSQGERDALAAYEGLVVARLDLGLLELYVGSTWHRLALLSDIPSVPRIWTGRVNITPVANTPTSARVTFPAGRFTSTPRVFVTADSTVPGERVIEVTHSDTSASGTTVWLYRNNATATWVDVLAVQA